MRRVSVLAIVALFVLSGCASSVQRTPLEDAKVAYVDASFAYEAGMQSLVALRAAHRVTDAQWSEIDMAQRAARDMQPAVRVILSAWGSSGVKPPMYDGVARQFSEAVAVIIRILAEVQK